MLPSHRKSWGLIDRLASSAFDPLLPLGYAGMLLAYGHEVLGQRVIDTLSTN
jgi:hypothetical protein